MIELTQEQAQGVAEPETSPPRVVNPQTQEVFVLLPLTEYERLIEDTEYDYSPWSDEERDLLREEACRLVDSI
jgi:hypothetical protein